ncbi:sigma-70 family RNA polymerase sigma factor [Paenibacillus woosongensis]|uniref:sigma-70 family RNA polymerase sigma factor n=1 Tax=Paenibacillus woosongensis TaxID=307580 RepID=UPI002E7B01C6|nr:sigma-70 family RNA polymerase sigma factor [Paenibacillus woosongensis]
MQPLQNEDARSVQMGMDIDALYRNYRTYAFSIAYRMLGVISDAEDVVQDWFAEMQSKDMTEIRDVKAYLAKGITNRSLNVLKSARKQREVYVGEWLPEPLVSDYDSPERTLERQDAISYAYLVMLERLTPMERAVYLLREVFQYDYPAISEMLGKSESNCRKICSRAKKSLNSEEIRIDDHPTLDEGNKRKLIERFIAAFERYQMEELLELLSEDAVMISDGGGYTRSAIFPITSRKRVLALLTSPKAFKELRRWEAVLTEVNGEVNLVFLLEGQLKGILCFRWASESNRIQNLYLLLNPYKLNHVQSALHE